MDGVELQILASDGSVVNILPGSVFVQEPLGATAQIPGAMLPILGAANTTHQVHFKLSLTLTDHQGPKPVGNLVEGFGITGPRTVAALDVIRAARFAFGDQSDDLIWDGLVVQAAGQAGLGDNLTLTFDQ